MTLTQCLYYVLGMVLSLLIGFMLGVLIRSSTGAIVAYFILTFLVPTVFGLLAGSQQWFHDLQPWVDIQFAQAGLFVFERFVDRHRSGRTSPSPASPGCSCRCSPASRW